MVHKLHPFSCNEKKAERIPMERRTVFQEPFLRSSRQPLPTVLGRQRSDIGDGGDWTGFRGIGRMYGTFARLARARIGMGDAEPQVPTPIGGWSLLHSLLPALLERCFRS